MLLPYRIRVISRAVENRHFFVYLCSEFFFLFIWFRHHMIYASKNHLLLSLIIYISTYSFSFHHMPKIPKAHLKDALECSVCHVRCQSRAGLTQHYNYKHRAYQSPPSPSPPPPPYDISDDNNDLNPYADKHESHDPNSDDHNSHHSRISHEMEENSYLGDQVKLFEASHIIMDQNAGWTYDVESESSCSFDIQELSHQELGHPYYPWTSRNDIWLSDLLFFKARMSTRVANMVMQGFKNGYLEMGKYKPTTSRRMLGIIDKALYIPVFINDICVYFRGFKL